jgi:hypothetical protein
MLKDEPKKTHSPSIQAKAWLFYCSFFLGGLLSPFMMLFDIEEEILLDSDRPSMASI